MTGADALARYLGDNLLAASLQGALFALVVWVACRGNGRIRPSIQAWVWWLVCGRLLAALLPLPAVPLPLLPPAARPAVDVNVLESAPAVAAGRDPDRATAPPAAPVSWPTYSLPAALLALWAIAVAVHAARLGAAYVAMRRIVRSSTPASDESRSAAAAMAARLGLARVPNVLCSDEVASPQTVGVRRPLVLLPAASDAAWSPSARAMVLAHELMHVRRRDVALGWIPAIAERLFFFHPLARLAAGEYLIAREAACDAGAIEALEVAPERYGELLVAIGVHRGAPSFAAATGAWSSSSLKRRLEMLQYSSPQRMSGAARWALAVAACVCLMPFQLVARPAAEHQGPRPVGPQAAVAQVSVPPGQNGETEVSGQSREAAPQARRRLVSARLEAEAARLSAVDEEREAREAAGLQARQEAPGNADAASIDRAVAEMSAAIERMSRQLAGAADSDQDRARLQIEVKKMLDALQAQSQRQDGPPRDAAIREMLEALQANARSLQSEASRREMAELIAAAERADDHARAAEAALEAARVRQRDAEEILKAQTDELQKTQQALEGAQQALRQQLEQLRKDQEALREQQRALQQEWERLRAETRK